VPLGVPILAGVPVPNPYPWVGSGMGLHLMSLVDYG